MSKATAEPSNKCAVIGFPTLFLKIHSLYRGGISSLKMIPSNLGAARGGLIYKMGSPLKLILDKKTKQLFESGIVDHWIKWMVKFKSVLKAEEIGPQVKFTS